MIGGSTESSSYQAQRQGFFCSSDGTPIYYEVAGEGPPLLFCYGLVCRREHWRHQLDFFCQNHQVVVFDYRGHQRSAVPSNDSHLTISWCAEDAIQLANHLEMEQVVLLGHSMGVPVASTVAARIPERVKGLVLVCGTVTNPFDGMFHTNRLMALYEGMHFLYQHSPRLMAVLWKRFTELNRLNFLITSHLGFNPYLAEEGDVLRYMEGVNRTPLQVFYSLLADYVHFDGRELLGQIVCPTLVVAGNDDQITPLPLQEEMARLLKQGQLVNIPMGSHNAHMDVPDMVNQKIESFLKEVGYR